jgi:hypothetical protein
MEISNSAPSIGLTSNLSEGDAFSNVDVSGTGSQGGAVLSNTLGSQTDVQGQLAGGPQLGATAAVPDNTQLESAAETAFASVFFSLLQNILAEAQNNSGS